MQNITRARARAKDAGTPLPTVFKTLAANGVHFRRAQLALIAAAPGGAKSVLSATLAIKAGARGLYFSADSDESEQYSRAYSILTGTSLTEVLERMEAGEVPEYDRALAERLGHLRFDYDANPNLDHIESNVFAYAYVFGRFPEVIVVDNLRDVVADDMGGESYMVAENILGWLKDLARKTQACVIVLHHVVGEWENGDKPIPQSGLRGKVAKIPQLILTLYREEDPYGDGTSELGVAIVKNRGGRASASGKFVVPLYCDLSTMTIRDPDKAPGFETTDEDFRRMLEEMN
ncbi:DnaB-like helicase C-terminal domain-containing protein [Nonomuraea sp. NPDC059007]|uniref:DnaB-like helicase C-terminal domain-containing protein n=1 Tax=Nonomuraea sp. NPDC059007 TaxID=3346692 RepID=UPI0036A89A9B